MISIIVPAYNIEKYLADCIESVLAQTETDWELILVDDGSSDDTATICDRYAATDARIHCVHKENGGVASARNTALELARGEYILFLDGDDELSPELLARLLSRMEPDVDIVCCSCTVFSRKTGLEQPRSFLIGDRDMRNMSEKEPLFLQLHDGRIGQSPGKIYTAIGVPWGKLYRASLIRENNLRFPPMRLFEDNIFNMYAFTLARRIIYLDAPLYRYRADHCASNVLTPEVRLQILERRDEYYGRFGSLATEGMRIAYFAEKLRCFGAACKHYARELSLPAAAKAIRELSEQSPYSILCTQAPPCTVEPRYRLIVALVRMRLWPVLAVISALRGR